MLTILLLVLPVLMIVYKTSYMINILKETKRGDTPAEELNELYQEWINMGQPLVK